MLPGKVACPHCHNILRSSREAPLGKKIKCLKCGVPFLVTEEEVRRAEALDAAAAAAPPPTAPPSKPPESAPLPTEVGAAPEAGEEFYLGVDEPPKPEPAPAPPPAAE